ncbi:hypothetical protein DHEL01_v201165 [Diaporthe helianthi]|uniref:Uncharacterized protein n=1 Tax=Diaporthe helianthi TaxID=158607 RepID=A0A2P5ID48_DIAHE|nr:hypothetical protein DHEL01_v201165 [Diaporthe helianthi]
MEPTPADMAALAAEGHPQNLTKLRVRDGVMRDSRDDNTMILLIFVAFFSCVVSHTLINSPAVPPLAVLCVTSCDVQFLLNVLITLLTLGMFGFIHAIWVVLHYGKGGRLSWGQRRKIERQRIAGALDFPANTGHPEARGQAHAGALESPTIPVHTRPTQVHNEADTDAPAYSVPVGGHAGDSKYL